MADGKLAIVVGGGPAPGINSVIGAATIRGVLSGYEVLGLRDGYRWLMEGDLNHAQPLTISETSRIHFRGGSHLGISRANPTKNPKDLDKVLACLNQLGVRKLISIGGDDTAFSAHRLAQASKGSLHVVHVPKTIDNDLDLPLDVPTFGYQTARSIGVDIVKSLMVDAKTTSRYYFVIAMGRKAGHLALGIGKAAGATLSLIPEEFGPDVRLKHVVDTLTAAIIKRVAQGRHHGVAVIAEGIAESLPEEDLAMLPSVERDEHGHIRIAEIDLGNIIKSAVQRELNDFGVKMTIVAKNIGYEVRCADPNPFDMEYTRDLGYCAAQYVMDGGNEALITIQNGRFVPIPFFKIMDPDTGRMRVRMVDIESDRYKIARTYMLRLKQDDFDSNETLEPIANVASMTPAEFRMRYSYLVESEPTPLAMRDSRAPIKI